MSEKIIGYVLLASGIFAILFALFSVIQVFTKVAEPIQIFNFPPIEFGVNQLFSNMSSDELRALQELNKGEIPKIDILPADVLNQSSNIIAHVFFMGFVASIGYKLGSLGIMMLRPIKVNLKEEKQNGSTQKQKQ